MNFLPGWTPDLGEVGPPPLEFIGFSTSNGTTITPHASSTVGDLAVLFDRGSGGGTGGSPPAEVIPTGFTSLYNSGVFGVSQRAIISARVLAATSAVTGMASDEDSAKVMLVFRRASGISGFSAHSVGAAAGSSGSPAANVSVTAGGGVVPLVVFGFISGRLANPAFGSSPAIDDSAQQNTGTCTGRAGYKLYNAAPANHTLSSSWGANNERLVGFYLQVT